MSIAERLTKTASKWKMGLQEENEENEAEGRNRRKRSKIYRISLTSVRGL